jgi:hypothetical protein
LEEGATAAVAPDPRPWYKRPMYLALIIGGVIAVLVGSALGIYYGLIKKADVKKPDSKKDDDKKKGPEVDPVQKALDDFKQYAKYYELEHQLDLKEDEDAIQAVLTAFSTFDQNVEAKARLNLQTDHLRRYQLMVSLAAKGAPRLTERWNLELKAETSKEFRTYFQRHAEVLLGVDAWLKEHKEYAKAPERTKEAYEESKKQRLDQFLAGACPPPVGTRAMPSPEPEKLKYALITGLKQSARNHKLPGMPERSPVTMPFVPLDSGGAKLNSSFQELQETVVGYARRKLLKDAWVQIQAPATRDKALTDAAARIKKVKDLFSKTPVTYGPNDACVDLLEMTFDDISDATTAQRATNLATNIVKDYSPTVAANLAEIQRVILLYKQAIVLLDEKVVDVNNFAQSAAECTKAFDPFLKAFSLRSALHDLTVEQPAKIADLKTKNVSDDQKNAVEEGFNAVQLTQRTALHAMQVIKDSLKRDPTKNNQYTWLQPQCDQGVPAAERPQWEYLKKEILDHLNQLKEPAEDIDNRLPDICSMKVRNLEEKHHKVGNKAFKAAREGLVGEALATP